MTRIGRLLSENNIDVDDLGLQRPSLDDVFLHLTGHRAESESVDGEPTTPEAEDALR
jgi:ABC-2 type transport system ATP-binding protein